MATKFQVQARQWIEKARLDSKVATRRMAFILYDRIIERTPVDTGRARASWNITPGSEPDLSVAPESVMGEEVSHTFRDRLEDDAVEPDKLYVISNNLPYAEPLENGHSKQAPLGMVRLAIADLRTRMEVELG